MFLNNISTDFRLLTVTSKGAQMSSSSTGYRVATAFIGGVGLCGLQLFYLLNAKLGANIGYLLGALVGCVFGTVIGVVLAARRPPETPKPKALAENQRLSAAEKMKRWARKAFTFWKVSWVVAALFAFISTQSPHASVPAITFGVAFGVGLIALIIGTALGDAGKRYENG